MRALRSDAANALLYEEDVVTVGSSVAQDQFGGTSVPANTCQASSDFATRLKVM
jgi:hypothetical protein